MKVVKSHTSAFSRLVHEGVVINRGSANRKIKILNSKSEFGAISLPRLIVDDDMAKEESYFVRDGNGKVDRECNEGNDKLQKDSVVDGTELASQSVKLKTISNLETTSTTAAQSKPNRGNPEQNKTRLKLARNVAIKRKFHEDEVG